MGLLKQTQPKPEPINITGDVGGVPQTTPQKLDKPFSLLDPIKKIPEVLRGARKFAFPTRRELLEDIQKERGQTLIPEEARKAIIEREKEFAITRPPTIGGDFESFLDKPELDFIGAIGGLGKRVFKKALKTGAEGIPISTKKLEAKIASRAEPLVPSKVEPVATRLEKQFPEKPIEVARRSDLLDDSLVDIVKKEPTPVKDKVNIVDYIRTPDRVLKKIGLEKEGKVLRVQNNKYLKELPKNIEVITSWVKRASRGSSENIFRYLDGEKITLKAQDKLVADEIKTWLSKWADRLKLPKEKRITNYITHIFDQELITKEFPEELAKMIEKKVAGEVYNPFLQKRLGGLGFKRDVWPALDAYVKRATRKVHMDPALEKIKGAAETLEQTQFDYVKGYVDKINMRPGKIDNLIDNGIKQLIGYKLGQRPLLAITGWLRRMTYRAMLGLNLSSALKNVSQGINTYAKLGEKYTTLGYLSLFKKGAAQELIDEGVLNHGFIEDRALSSTKKAIQAFDKVLYFFFENAERLNRGAAYFGAKKQYLAKNASKKIPSEKLEAEAVEYAKKMVRDTQFVFGAVDTPIVLNSDLGKTIGQFQSFTTKQIEFLAEMSKKAVKGDQKAKNFIGLLRYALAGTAFVYTVGQAFNMKPKDLIPFWRFGIPPSLGLPTEIGKAALDVPGKYGQERDVETKLKDIGKAGLGLVPGGIQAKKTFQGTQAVLKGRAETKAGDPQFDVGGTLPKNIQAIVFGKYAGEGARKYYDEEPLRYTRDILSHQLLENFLDP